VEILAAFGVASRPLVAISACSVVDKLNYDAPPDSR
jgi:hypothetical protein